MQQPLLFYTTTPVLLGGSPRDAGRLAALLYARHGITLHWFGRGWHPLTAVYASRHPVSLSPAEENDELWVRLLLDLAKAKRAAGGILCLIPGSEEAEAFLGRMRERLEEHFVMLDRPARGEDPLYGLVHSH